MQNEKPVDGYNVIHLGSEYGGKFLVHDAYLYGSTIISAGLGEDASFDIEFASKYNAKVVCVDPTPRAVDHFNEIQLAKGSIKKRYYSQSGKQPIDAYDLSEITDNLVLIPKALWNKICVLNFYAPIDPNHVSHSISNYQNNYSPQTDSIEVNTITMRVLISELGFNIDNIPLLKLDIEGAEIEVLEDCLSNGIYPRQILVEFDEIDLPKKLGHKRVSKIDSLLKSVGYIMVKSDGQADFLYYRPKD